MAVKLSIVICTYNRAEGLADTLESVTKQTFSSDEWEVVVVNNNSTDTTLDVCRKFAVENLSINFRTVTEKRQGVSFARNRGIEEAVGEFVIYIDDDQTVNPEYLETYHTFFKEHPEAKVAGGPVLPQYDFTPPRWLTPYTERPIASTLYLGDKPTIFKGKKYPNAGNMAIQRELLAEEIRFDTKLGRSGDTPFGGEEKELVFRLKNMGEQIYYLPNAIAYHIIPESRLTPEYLFSVNRLYGISERIRTLGKSKWTYTKQLFDEILKWCATSVLLILYTLKGRPVAGWYLVRMRWNITLGLLGAKPRK